MHIEKKKNARLIITNTVVLKILENINLKQFIKNETKIISIVTTLQLMVDFSEATEVKLG